mgnify:CR=1 FL=1|tara:strand:+ start:2609 stop:3160 length:552 start_codon:yes stop_codon:yes gene_type:complete
MTPKEWGPIIWYLIHIITYGIPNDEYFKNYSNYYFQFFHSLKKIIPCPICRKHLGKMINNNDLLKCSTKEEIIIWCIDIHNQVNKRLSKSQITKDEIDKLYSTVNLNKLIKSIDILTYNFQMRFPINCYKNFFDSLRIVFPIESIRLLYQEGMKQNNIKVRNHNDLIKWYMNLGNYIVSNLKT